MTWRMEGAHCTSAGRPAHLLSCRGPAPPFPGLCLGWGPPPGVLVALSHGHRTLGEESLSDFPKPLDSGPRIGK